MKEKILYGLWAFLFILCIGLGTIENPTPFGKVVLLLVALVFFIPGALLLYDGLRTGNVKAVRRIRLIALISLVLTLVLLVVNVCCVHASEAVGNAMYDILLIVSSPMICSQYWVVSLFLWACLLMAGLKRKKKSKK